MINTSTRFKQAMEKNSACVSRATVLLKDGTTLNLKSSDMSEAGVKINDSVSGTGSFDIGRAIINKLTLNINNRYDEFSDYDFTGAVITVWIGKQLSNQMEWLKKGVFNADDPTATSSILTIEALDNMSKFDKAYDGNLTFPTTLQSIVQYCCSKCGVLLVNGQFPNYSYQIQENPFEEKNNVTYRSILSYCALIAGCYARCNVDGRLELKWYDTAAFDGDYDGGIFDETTGTYYQTGDNLDGGNFTDYDSGDEADGGTFTDDFKYRNIYSFSSLSVSTEDVVITGIRVTASDSETIEGEKLEGESYLCGVEGYVLEISGNPLVEYGQAKAVAEYLAGRVVDMRFRPFSASAIGDPSWEAGDAAIVTDRKGNGYQTYLTSVTYSVGNYASISCDAEPAARHSADRYSEIEQIVANIKKDSMAELSTYAKYVDQLNQLALNAMGYYETTEYQDDGSMIKYMHDKPLLADSMVIYKNSIDGFFWSKDGGKTYTLGVDRDGNAVMNVIAAIGIRADWIDADSITAKQLSVEYKNSVSEEIKDVTTAKFNVADGKISAEVERAIGREETLRSGISMVENSISMEVTRAKGQEETLRSGISLNESNIRLKVSKGDVSSQIGVETGSVNISSDRMIINSTNFKLSRSGRVTASGTMSSENGDYETQITSGAARFYYKDELIGRIEASARAKSEVSGTETSPVLDLKSNRDGIIMSLGNTYYYTLNNGLNTWGRTERHLFGGTTYFSDDMIVQKIKWKSNDTYYINYGEMNGEGGSYVYSSLYANGGMACGGTKYRVVNTKNYSAVGMNAVESTGAYFMDIGSAKIIDGTETYVYFDPVFIETLDDKADYTVQITRTSKEQVEYIEKKDWYFIAHGEEGATFDWQIIGKQKDYEQDYMERVDINHEEPIPYDESIFYGDSIAEDATQQLMIDLEQDYDEQARLYMEEYESEVVNYD